MNSEHLTSPSDPSHENPTVKGVETGEHFIKDEAAIERAIKYVDKNEPSWVLDPAGVMVEQPDNQGELIQNLSHLLGSKQDGDRLLSHLDENLSHIRAQLSENVSVASGRIKIKAGFDLQSMDTKDLSRDEYKKLLAESFPDEETVEDIDQPNLMLTGLLEATGAKLLRDDLADGNGTGKRVYKGIFDGKPIYFTEHIATRVDVKEDGSRSTRLARIVTTETEDIARASLDSLSENDIDVLRSIGVDMPLIGSSDYNPENYPTRSRMAETLRLYGSMNHEADPLRNLETSPNFQTAIDTLTKLQERVGTASLAYYVTPNVVLTLSGARAYCDDVFYAQGDEKLDDLSHQITESLDALKSTEDVYFAQNGIDHSTTGKKYAGYGVLFARGLARSLESTQLLDEAGRQELLKQKLSGEELTDKMVALLKQNKQLVGLSDENLTHVAFGILVGYPDKAITGSIRKWDEDPSKSENPLVDARIEGASYYNCPQPVYSYPRSLADDPDIVAHEQLWSSILNDFYKSDFHTKLAADPDFKAKAKELGLYELGE